MFKNTEIIESAKDETDGESELKPPKDQAQLELENLHMHKNKVVYKASVSQIRPNELAGVEDIYYKRFREFSLQCTSIAAVAYSLKREEFIKAVNDCSLYESLVQFVSLKENFYQERVAQNIHLPVSSRLNRAPGKQASPAKNQRKGTPDAAQDESPALTGENMKVPITYRFQERSAQGNASLYIAAKRPLSKSVDLKRLKELSQTSAQHQSEAQKRSQEEFLRALSQGLRSL